MANRKAQIQKIQQKAQELSEEIDGLITELEEAFDNMPEAFQEGDRGEKAQERISTLSEWRDALTDMAEEDEV